MKVFYGFIFLVAITIIFTSGFGRSNNFFNSRNVGESKYLTPAGTPYVSTVDTTAEAADEHGAEGNEAAAHGGHEGGEGHGGH